MGEEKEEPSEHVLGKSPTIFSLMKSDNGTSFSFGSASAYSVMPPLRGSLNSSTSGSSAGGSSRKDDEDDLQFSISLNDDSLLESESDGFLLF